MSCTHPIQVQIQYKDQSIQARKERVMKGEHPTHFIGYVPCGKCYGCLSYRRNQWTFRLKCEMYYSKSTYFCTLTYADPQPLDGVSKKHLVKVTKYLRDKCNYKFTYYGIGEYGTTTQRAHYHLMLFFKENYDINMIISDLQKAHSNRHKSRLEWHYDQLGHIEVAPVSLARLHYITHYHVRPKQPVPDKNPCFCIMSKGLGNQWFTDSGIVEFVRQAPDYNIHDLSGQTHILPAYYRRKYNIEKKDCHCAITHPFISKLSEFEKFNKMSVKEQVRYIKGKQLADANRLEKYNKQIKLTDI